MADNALNKPLFSKISKWTLLIVSLLILVYMIYNITSGAYTLLKDCWVCGVFESIYDTFSRVANQTFYIFQNDSLVILSVCLALWIAYETYKIFIKSVGLDPSVQVNLDPEYLKKIYKKMFLATVVIGLFIINSPRNIFANTYEIVLDFGSGVGRFVIQKKINEMQLSIPPECQNQSTNLIYKEGNALSENTKNNMVCLIKEINVLRQSYMDIGINLFEHGIFPISLAIITNIGIRVGGFFLGRNLEQYGTDKWLEKIQKAIQNKKLKGKKAEQLKQKLDEVLKDIKDNKSKNTKRTQKTGEFISNNAGRIANISSIAAFITNQDIRMGLSGIALVIGLFMVNMLFAFIIVENLLFMGVSLLIFPFLAICYVFDETRSYAKKGLSDLFGFAIGLIFMCVGMIICAEINDWVLGGMLSAESTNNITTTNYMLKLLQEGDIETFNKLASPFYFFYIIFALLLNFKIVQESYNFASWFMGNISESGLGSSVWKFSKSVISWSQSLYRENIAYAKRTDKATNLDKLKSATHGITDKFNKTFNKKEDNK